MVENLTGGKALPAEVVQQIVTKTDGVPLFVEELTKTVLESGWLTKVNDHYEVSGPHTVPGDSVYRTGLTHGSTRLAGHGQDC
jgi:predicted ATPase